jgi:hypothetical protein
MSYSTVKDGDAAAVAGAPSKYSQGSLGQCNTLNNYEVAWEAMINDGRQWIEIDLLEPHDVAGICTVGSVSQLSVQCRTSKNDRWNEIVGQFGAGNVLFEKPIASRCVLFL